MISKVSDSFDALDCATSSSSVTPGWAKYSTGKSTEPWPIPKGILSMILGSIAVYGILLGVGQLIYNDSTGFLLITISVFASIGLFRTWK